MAPMCWTTPEQAAFLTSWLPEYEEHMTTKKYHLFWPPLFKAWFEKWSERDSLFPDVDGLLNAEQSSELGAAIEACHKPICLIFLIKRLQTWFRWRTNALRQNRLQQKRTSVFEKAIEPKGSRILSQSEIYSVEYYNDRIKPRLDIEKETGKLQSRGDVLRAGHKLSKELLEAEDKEIKDRVEEIYKMQKRKEKTEEVSLVEPTDANEIQWAIDDLPFALARVAELIKSRTRFAISFICTGPDPSRNWDISSISCHPDKNPQAPALRDPTRAASGPDESGVVEVSTGTAPPAGDRSDDGDIRMSEGVQDDADGVSEDEGNVVDEPGNGRKSDNEVREENAEEVNEPEIRGHALLPQADNDASFLDTDMYCMDPAGAVPVSSIRSSLGCDASSLASMIESQNSSFATSPFDLGVGLSTPIVASLTGPGQSSMSLDMSVQHALPLNYVNSDISSGQNGRTAADPISFSDEMTNIRPGLAGGGWNFSAIGLDVFDPNLHPPPQFDTVADPPLPPLPPVPQEITRGRPRLPAVSLPSLLINGTPVNANNDTSRTRPKSRGRGRRNVASMPKSPLAWKMAAKALKPQDCAVSGIATGVGLSMIPPSNSTASVDLLQDPNPPLTQQANASTSTDLSGIALPVIQHPLTQQNPAPPLTLQPSKRIPIQSK
ncbi:hypothetical protein L210DRAFT_3508096 [Boletus edulis BED1]|uniref:Uncharacterized protein n=1 Tax=Boletus edulis BED1 TaxID=1328754 RepID=A0AAD4G993_BOLED|nr:hypothetical protein L210DRAFT_3508096 [Boletus edulis BED1]